MSSDELTGSASDMVERLKAALPARWFADVTPVLDTVLAGLADAASWLYGLLGAAQSQMRLLTATSGFLDLIAADFFGNRLRRGAREGDDAYRERIIRALARTRGTRTALVAAVTDLTGTPPVVFEPSQTGDTGAYSSGGIGWNMAGGWGSVSLPFQSFVTVTRPNGQGIAMLSGYGTGGPISYASLSMIAGQVTDADIYATVAETLPAASIAWTHITG